MNSKPPLRERGKRKIPAHNRGPRTQALGAMLRELRQQKGIGLRQLASRVGISAPYLSNIERGKFPPPSEKKLLAIAHALDQDPDCFLAKTSEPPDIIDPACGTGQFFGEALRELREQNGIGLREFATKVGMSAPYLSNVERGKVPPPSEERQCVIARELGQDQDQWLAKSGKVRSR
jgi:transcriptional regulator with XRE-family HTH domain